MSPEGMEKGVTFISPSLSLVKECSWGITLLHCQVCPRLRMAEWILTDNPAEGQQRIILLTVHERDEDQLK